MPPSLAIAWSEFGPRVRRLPKRWLFATATILLCAPVLLYSALRYDLPMGSGGLFAQMAEQIAATGFELPLWVSYYGPGPVPFAYPPLGFYLMALFTKIGVHPATYMRWMPPLLSLAAAAPLFLLSERLTKSNFAALLVCVIVASSPVLITMHAFAAGAVRGLAFGLLLWAMYFFVRAVEVSSRLPAVVAGICFGLAVLTHLFYGLVLAVWVAAWLIAKPRRSSWTQAAVTTIVAALLVAPWLATILSRYGADVVTGVLGSHGNTTFLEVLGSPAGLGQWIWRNLAPVSQEPLLGLCAVLGSVFLLAQRRLALPLAFAASLWVFSEGERFTVMFAALSAAGVAEMGSTWFASAKWPRIASYGLLTAATVLSAQHGFQQISRLTPTLHKTTLELAAFVQHNSDSESTFLFVGNQDEAEWLPYLLQREPTLSKWGAEWLGTYSQQQHFLLEIMSCQAEQSLNCVQQLLERAEVADPDLLITRKGDRVLGAQLMASDDWSLMSEVGRYVVWQRRTVATPSST